MVELEKTRQGTMIQMAKEMTRSRNVWGGDPVYPTVNYIQDPDEVIDYKGPDFHEPTPNMLSFLEHLLYHFYTQVFTALLSERHGKIISRWELEKILSKEKTKELEAPDMDEAMAQTVDIGEDDEGEDSEAEVDEQGEKITRNWSVLKTTRELTKSKGKPKKDAMSVEEAVDDSENLTDFLMDCEEEV